MKYILIKKKKEKGYALLFTLVIVMSISLITAGLSSTITKQLNLSLLTKNSQVAFSQADIASECGLYIDGLGVIDQNYIDDGTKGFNCGGEDLIFKEESLQGDYTLIKDTGSDSNTPCFSINVQKNNNTTIKANGYSICNTNNPRSVERTIEIKY